MLLVCGHLNWFLSFLEMMECSKRDDGNDAVLFTAHDSAGCIPSEICSFFRCCLSEVWSIKILCATMLPPPHLRYPTNPRKTRYKGYSFALLRKKNANFVAEIFSSTNGYKNAAGDGGVHVPGFWLQAGGARPPRSPRTRVAICFEGDAGRRGEPWRLHGPIGGIRLLLYNEASTPLACPAIPAP